MNPRSVGGNRNKLPRSVTCHFTTVQLDDYSSTEVFQILQHHTYKETLGGGATVVDWPLMTLTDLALVHSIHLEVQAAASKRIIGKSGGPYDFNLRDLGKLRDVLDGNSRDLRDHCKFFAASSNTTQGTTDDSDVRRLAVRKFTELVYARRFYGEADAAVVIGIINKHLPLASASKSLVAEESVDDAVTGFLRIGTVYMKTGSEDTSDCSGLVHTRETVRQLEVLAAACQSTRGVLLEGDTASRKTSLVRELARLARRRLVVVPMNENTEPGDLIGSWLPVKATYSAHELHGRVTQHADACAKYMVLFVLPNLRGDKVKYNNSVSGVVAISGTQGSLTAAVAADPAADGSTHGETSPGSIIRVCIDALEVCTRVLDTAESAVKDASIEVSLLCRRHRLRCSNLLQQLQVSRASKDSGTAFDFVESPLVQAIREGWWVLLDNVNSAPPDAIERLNSLTEDDPFLKIFENTGEELTRTKPVDGGSKQAGMIHEDFRLFATANMVRVGSNKLSGAFLNRMLRIWLPAIDHGLEATADVRTHDTWPILTSMLQGVHGGYECAALCLEVHKTLAKDVSEGKIVMISGVPITFRHLLHAMKTTRWFVENLDVSPPLATAWALCRSYVMPITVPEQRRAAMSLFRDSITKSCEVLHTSIIAIPPVLRRPQQWQLDQVGLLETMLIFEQSAIVVLSSMIYVADAMDLAAEACELLISCVVVRTIDAMEGAELLEAMQAARRRSDLAGMKEILRGKHTRAVETDSPDLLRVSSSLSKCKQNLTELMQRFAMNASFCDAAARHALFVRISLVAEEFEKLVQLSVFAKCSHEAFLNLRMVLAAIRGMRHMHAALARVGTDEMLLQAAASFASTLNESAAWAVQRVLSEPIVAIGGKLRGLFEYMRNANGDGAGASLAQYGTVLEWKMLEWDVDTGRPAAPVAFRALAESALNWDPKCVLWQLIPIEMNLCAAKCYHLADIAKTAIEGMEDFDDVCGKDSERLDDEQAFDRVHARDRSVNDLRAIFQEISGKLKDALPPAPEAIKSLTELAAIQRQRVHQACISLLMYQVEKGGQIRSQSQISLLAPAPKLWTMLRQQFILHSSESRILAVFWTALFFGQLRFGLPDSASVGLVDCELAESTPIVSEGDDDMRDFYVVVFISFKESGSMSVAIVDTRLSASSDSATIVHFSDGDGTHASAVEHAANQLSRYVKMVEVEQRSMPQCEEVSDATDSRLDNGGLSGLARSMLSALTVIATFSYADAEFAPAPAIVPLFISNAVSNARDLLEINIPVPNGVSSMWSTALELQESLVAINSLAVSRADVRRSHDRIRHLSERFNTHLRGKSKQEHVLQGMIPASLEGRREVQAALTAFNRTSSGRASLSSLRLPLASAIIASVLSSSTGAEREAQQFNALCSLLDDVGRLSHFASACAVKGSMKSPPFAQAQYGNCRALVQMLREKVVRPIYDIVLLVPKPRLARDVPAEFFTSMREVAASVLASVCAKASTISRHSLTMLFESHGILLGIDGGASIRPSAPVVVSSSESDHGIGRPLWMGKLQVDAEQLITRVAACRERARDVHARIAQTLNRLDAALIILVDSAKVSATESVPIATATDTQKELWQAQLKSLRNELFGVEQSVEQYRQRMQDKGLLSDMPQLLTLVPRASLDVGMLAEIARRKTRGAVWNRTLASSIVAQAERVRFQTDRLIGFQEDTKQLCALVREGVTASCWSDALHTLGRVKALSALPATARNIEHTSEEFSLMQRLCSLLAVVAGRIGSQVEHSRLSRRADDSAAAVLTAHEAGIYEAYAASRVTALQHPGSSLLKYAHVTGLSQCVTSNRDIQRRVSLLGLFPMLEIVHSRHHQVSQALDSASFGSCTVLLPQLLRCADVLCFLVPEFVNALMGVETMQQSLDDSLSVVGAPVLHLQPKIGEDAATPGVPQHPFFIPRERHAKDSILAFVVLATDASEGIPVFGNDLAQEIVKHTCNYAQEVIVAVSSAHQARVLTSSDDCFALQLWIGLWLTTCSVHALGALVHNDKARDNWQLSHANMEVETAKKELCDQQGVVGDCMRGLKSAQTMLEGMRGGYGYTQYRILQIEHDVTCKRQHLDSAEKSVVLCRERLYNAQDNSEKTSQRLRREVSDELRALWGEFDANVERLVVVLCDDFKCEAGSRKQGEKLGSKAARLLGILQCALLHPRMTDECVRVARAVDEALVSLKHRATHAAQNFHGSDQTRQGLLWISQVAVLGVTCIQRTTVEWNRVHDVLFKSSSAIGSYAVLADDTRAKFNAIDGAMYRTCAKMLEAARKAPVDKEFLDLVRTTCAFAKSLYMPLGDYGLGAERAWLNARRFVFEAIVVSYYYVCAVQDVLRGQLSSIVASISDDKDARDNERVSAFGAMDATGLNLALISYCQQLPAAACACQRIAHFLVFSADINPMELVRDMSQFLDWYKRNFLCPGYVLFQVAKVFVLPLVVADGALKFEDLYTPETGAFVQEFLEAILEYDSMGDAFFSKDPSRVSEVVDRLCGKRLAKLVDASSRMSNGIAVDMSGALNKFCDSLSAVLTALQKEATKSAVGFIDACIARRLLQSPAAVRQHTTGDVTGAAFDMTAFLSSRNVGDLRELSAMLEAVRVDGADEALAEVLAWMQSSSAKLRLLVAGLHEAGPRLMSAVDVAAPGPAMSELVGAHFTRLNRCSDMMSRTTLASLRGDASSPVDAELRDLYTFEERVVMVHLAASFGEQAAAVWNATVAKELCERIHDLSGKVQLWRDTIIQPFLSTGSRSDSDRRVRQEELLARVGRDYASKCTLLGRKLADGFAVIKGAISYPIDVVEPIHRFLLDVKGRGSTFSMPKDFETAWKALPDPDGGAPMALKLCADENMHGMIVSLTDGTSIMDTWTAVRGEMVAFRIPQKGPLCVEFRGASDFKNVNVDLRKKFDLSSKSLYTEKIFVHGINYLGWMQYLPLAFATEILHARLAESRDSVGVMPGLPSTPITSTAAAAELPVGPSRLLVRYTPSGHHCIGMCVGITNYHTSSWVSGGGGVNVKSEVHVIEFSVLASELDLMCMIFLDTHGKQARSPLEFRMHNGITMFNLIGGSRGFGSLQIFQDAKTTVSPASSTHAPVGRQASVARASVVQDGDCFRAYKDEFGALKSEWSRSLDDLVKQNSVVDNLRVVKDAARKWNTWHFSERFESLCSTILGDIEVVRAAVSGGIGLRNPQAVISGRVQSLVDSISTLQAIAETWISKENDDLSLLSSQRQVLMWDSYYHRDYWAPDPALKPAKEATIRSMQLLGSLVESVKDTAKSACYLLFAALRGAMLAVCARACATTRQDQFQNCADDGHRILEQTRFAHVRMKSAPASARVEVHTTHLKQVFSAINRIVAAKQKQLERVRARDDMEQLPVRCAVGNVVRALALVDLSSSDLHVTVRGTSGKYEFEPRCEPLVVDFGAVLLTANAKAERTLVVNNMMGQAIMARFIAEPTRTDGVATCELQPASRFVPTNDGRSMRCIITLPVGKATAKTIVVRGALVIDSLKRLEIEFRVTTHVVHVAFSADKLDFGTIVSDASVSPASRILRMQSFVDMPLYIRCAVVSTATGFIEGNRPILSVNCAVGPEKVPPRGYKDIVVQLRPKNIGASQIRPEFTSLVVGVGSGDLLYSIPIAAVVVPAKFKVRVERPDDMPLTEFVDAPPKHLPDVGLNRYRDCVIFVTNDSAAVIRVTLELKEQTIPAAFQLARQAILVPIGGTRLVLLRVVTGTKPQVLGAQLWAAVGGQSVACNLLCRSGQPDLRADQPMATWNLDLTCPATWLNMLGDKPIDALMKPLKRPFGSHKPIRMSNPGGTPALVSVPMNPDVYLMDTSTGLPAARQAISLRAKEDSTPLNLSPHLRSLISSRGTIALEVDSAPPKIVNVTWEVNVQRSRLVVTPGTIFVDELDSHPGAGRTDIQVCKIGACKAQYSTRIVDSVVPPGATVEIRVRSDAPMDCDRDRAITVGFTAMPSNNGVCCALIRFQCLEPSLWPTGKLVAEKLLWIPLIAKPKYSSPMEPTSVAKTCRTAIRFVFSNRGGAPNLEHAVKSSVLPLLLTGTLIVSALSTAMDGLVARHNRIDDVLHAIFGSHVLIEETEMGSLESIESREGRVAAVQTLCSIVARTKPSVLAEIYRNARALGAKQTGAAIMCTVFTAAASGSAWHDVAVSLDPGVSERMFASIACVESFLRKPASTAGEFEKAADLFRRIAGSEYTEFCDFASAAARLIDRPHSAGWQAEFIEDVSVNFAPDRIKSVFSVVFRSSEADLLGICRSIVPTQVATAVRQLKDADATTQLQAALRELGSSGTIALLANSTYRDLLQNDVGVWKRALNATQQPIASSLSTLIGEIASELKAHCKRTTPNDAIFIGTIVLNMFVAVAAHTYDLKHAAMCSQVLRALQADKSGALLDTHSALGIVKTMSDLKSDAVDQLAKELSGWVAAIQAKPDGKTCVVKGCRMILLFLAPLHGEQKQRLRFVAIAKGLADLIDCIAAQNCVGSLDAAGTLADCLCQSPAFISARTIFGALSRTAAVAGGGGIIDVIRSIANCATEQLEARIAGLLVRILEEPNESVLCYSLAAECHELRVTGTPQVAETLRIVSEAICSEVASLERLRRLSEVTVPHLRSIWGALYTVCSAHERINDSTAVIMPNDMWNAQMAAWESLLDIAAAIHPGCISRLAADAFVSSLCFACSTTDSCRVDALLCVATTLVAFYASDVQPVGERAVAPEALSWSIVKGGASMIGSALSTLGGSLGGMLTSGLGATAAATAEATAASAGLSQVPKAGDVSMEPIPDDAYRACRELSLNVTTADVVTKFASLSVGDCTFQFPIMIPSATVRDTSTAPGSTSASGDAAATDIGSGLTVADLRSVAEATTRLRSTFLSRVTSRASSTICIGDVVETLSDVRVVGDKWCRYFLLLCRISRSRLETEVEKAVLAESCQFLWDAVLLIKIADAACALLRGLSDTFASELHDQCAAALRDKLALLDMEQLGACPQLGAALQNLQLVRTEESQAFDLPCRHGQGPIPSEDGFVDLGSADDPFAHVASTTYAPISYEQDVSGGAFDAGQDAREGAESGQVSGAGARKPERQARDKASALKFDHINEFDISAEDIDMDDIGEDANTGPVDAPSEVPLAPDGGGGPLDDLNKLVPGARTRKTQGPRLDFTGLRQAPKPGAHRKGGDASHVAQIAFKPDAATIAKQIEKLDLYELLRKAGAGKTSRSNPAALIDTVDEAALRAAAQKKDRKWTYKRLADSKTLTKFVQRVTSRFRDSFRDLQDAVGSESHEFEWCVLIDNSGSMSMYQRQVAETLAVVIEVLRKLEIKFAVARFGNGTAQSQRVLKAFGEPFSYLVGESILERLTYNESSHVASGLEAVANGLWSQAAKAGVHRVILLITDGISTEVNSEMSAVYTEMATRFGFRLAVVNVCPRNAPSFVFETLKALTGGMAVKVDQNSIESMAQGVVKLVGNLLTDVVEEIKKGSVTRAAGGESAKPRDLVRAPGPDAVDASEPRDPTKQEHVQYRYYPVDRVPIEEIDSESARSGASMTATARYAVSAPELPIPGDGVPASSMDKEEGKSDAAVAAADILRRYREMVEGCKVLREFAASTVTSSFVAAQAKHSRTIEALATVLEEVVLPCNKYTRRRADLRGSQLYLPGLIKAVCTDFNYKKYFSTKSGGGRRDYALSLVIDVSQSMEGILHRCTVESCVEFVSSFARVGVEAFSIILFSNTVVPIKLEDQPFDAIALYALLHNIHCENRCGSCDADAIDLAVSMLKVGVLRACAAFWASCNCGAHRCQAFAAQRRFSFSQTGTRRPGSGSAGLCVVRRTRALTSLRSPSEWIGHT